MNRILPRLYLGCFEDVQACAEHGITHILSLCEACPESETIVLHRPIPDEVWLPPETWGALLYELDALLINGHRVLVHCRLGVSRSPALVAAYLVYAGHETDLYEAAAFCHVKRPQTKMHPETWRGVCEWRKTLT